MGLGYTLVMWLKEAATYGAVEDMAAGTRYVLPVRANPTLEKTIARIRTEHMRGVAGMQQAEDATGLVSAGGGLSGVVPCKGDFGIVLKHTTGKVTTGAPVGGVYTHTYHWTNKLFPGLSASLIKADASYNYHGCQVKNTSLSAKVGGALEWGLDLVGSDEAVVAAITAPSINALLTSSPYWLFKHGTFEIDDVVEPITEFKIDFANELGEGDEQSYALGSEKRQLLPRLGYGAGGNVKRRHDKDSGETSKFYAKFLSGAAAKLEFIFVNPDDADYTFKITLGAVHFDGKSPNPTDKGLVFEDIPFTAYDLNLSTSSIVVTDEQAGPATAEGAYDGAGA